MPPAIHKSSTMRLSFLLVVVLVVFATNCYGLSMKQIADNNRGQDQPIHDGDRGNLGQRKLRAEAEERDEVHHEDLPAFRSRGLQSSDTASVAKPVDVQSEERGGPIAGALKTLSQKSKNLFSRVKGLLGKDPTKLTPKDVEGLKKSSKLKGLLSKNPSALNKKSVGILRAYVAKHGWNRTVFDVAVALLGVGATVGMIVMLAKAPK
ncbi:uncharacterized protein KRP23_1769 [Phytophthora ramorum]|uniref:uncharacterized protein n=1 Tax=Phytophthora ramorum TaxID=164328 RepID=UPI0030B12F46|nr:hypothetical protein KRP23_1769 [Phytophthora ramorum]KAH7499031.1 hypothetical protein KRP22_11329 [Phytophthora ramorum]